MRRKPGLLTVGYSTSHIPQASPDVRLNEFNIQLLPQYMRDHIFGPQTPIYDDAYKDLVETAAQHLVSHGIDFSKSEIIRDVPKPPLVQLQGETIEQHFTAIANKLLRPYIPLFNQLCVCDIPEPPTHWSFIPGWVKYGANGPSEVSYPKEKTLVLDVEICMEVGSDPVLATAVSPTCWYSWVSPRLVMEQDEQWQKNDLIRKREHLIPIRGEEGPGEHQLIVGHNVSFDRCRLREEYNFAASNTYFVDTMALHTCVNGVTTTQRGKWLRANGKNNEKEDRQQGWMETASPGALQNLYKLYVGKELDKLKRDLFVEGSLEEIRRDFQSGISYCAKDVLATFEIIQQLIPLFRECCPSPVTILGMMEMGSACMPTHKKAWLNFVTSCDKYHKDSRENTSKILRDLADKACLLYSNKNYLLDPWMSHLDWSPINSGKKSNGEGDFNWYKQELGAARSEISVQKRIVPLLLRLVWEEHPLHHVEHLGWGYIVPAAAADKDSLFYTTWLSYLNKYIEFLLADSSNQHSLLQEVKVILEQLNKAEIHYKEEFEAVGKIASMKEEDLKIRTAKILSQMKMFSYETKFGKSFGRVYLEGFEFPFDFYRIPHKNGEDFNCGKPIGPDYQLAMQGKRMRSRGAESGEELLNIEKSISFWRSSCARIKQQIVVEDGEEAVILPNVCVAGTVTRRAVQNTWLIASNVYKDRVGSELKSLITAPPGYVFVGADVDAEELWIASLLSDSNLAKIHGCTGIGWMTLQGDKANGTDLHSRTANSLGITRNEAKVINYSRIYSSGLSNTIQLLTKFLPNEPLSEITEKAKNLHAVTKGIRTKIGAKDDMFVYKRLPKKSSDRNREWVGGTESYLFNKLEEIANEEEPRTPALNCRISSALLPRNVESLFYTSRINWVVQSSGVDYLHLLLVSMKWLMTSFGISGRYCISIHDDIRFLVEEQDAQRAVLALQLSNLYTRCLFSFMTDVPDLPLCVAFFSAVEIDKVLRKDPTDECITPSNPDGLEKGRGITKGQSFDIQSILKLVNTLDKVPIAN